MATNTWAQRLLRAEAWPKLRALVTNLRAREATARAEGRAARTEARTTCERGRAEARASAAEIRREATARAAARRLAAEDACKTGKRRARAETRTRVAAASGERRAARLQFRREREDEGAARKKGLARTSASERRAESDDEVRQNIDPSLWPLWRSVKRRIKASPRKSRTEAFLEYVEAHPSEAHEAIEIPSDATYAREAADYWRAQERERRRA